MNESRPRFSARAEELFDDFVCRREAGEAVDFNAVCAVHPEQAAELRSLHSAAEFLKGLLPGSLPSDSLDAQAKNSHGAGVLLALAPGSDARSQSALLAKLHAVEPRGARYRVQREVGRGGMGAVLEVWDDELRRTLAMKVVLERGERELHATPAVDPKTLGRFLEEAQITGQLDHPGIVPVHELGLRADGRVYFTMRLVNGDDLREIFQRVRDGTDGWNQVRALGVMLKVCEAMSYAHAKNVIHRDLKPANVMVGKYGEAYVMDWGLARVLGREDTHDLRIQPQSSSQPSAVATERREQRDASPSSPLLTMDGDALGTPSYMPPEQARGELTQLGPHSDVYSVGAMLYQLIGGEMPFAPRGERLSTRAIVDAVVAGPPRPLHELAPRATPELIAICEKAMAREIAERYATMQALADDLRAFNEGRVVRAYETGTWAETRKWVQRNTAFAVALAVAVVLAVIGTSALITNHKAAQRAELDGRRLGALNVANKLGELKRDAAYPEFASKLEPPATEWWLATAKDLISGESDATSRAPDRNRGLAAYEQLLAELRATSRAPGPAPLAPYPRRAELEAKRDELQWRSHMLGPEPWPNERKAEDELALEDLPTDCVELSKRAFELVGVNRPRRFGDEARALVLARRAERAATTPLNRARCCEVLAFALSRCGRFDEALQRQREAIREAEKARAADGDGPPSTDSGGLSAAYWTRASSDNYALLESEVESLSGRAGEDQRAELAAEVASMDREARDWERWKFDDVKQQSLHDQLTRLVKDLSELRDRTAQAERATESAAARALWQQATDAVAKEPKYRGLRITRQLDLLPLGADPRTHLWEFAHMPTGSPPRRDAERRLVRGRTTGLVFVLLPAGRLPDADAESLDLRPPIEIEPFFLSKYEMTNEQWMRAAHPWIPRVTDEFCSHPATSVSWDDCVATFYRVGGWLKLPSPAQWTYGCRGGTATPWWTGSKPDSLVGRENLLFDKADAFAVRVGRYQANDFGLYDMLGNVSEWCDITPVANAQPPADRSDTHTLESRTHPFRGGAFSYGPDSVEFPSRCGEASAWLRAGTCGVRPARPLTP